MSLKTAGRVIALVMLAQAPLAPVVNFALLAPVTKSPGFLANGATHASQLRLAAMLWFLSGALSIGIAAVAISVIRRFSDTMATWLLSVSIAGVVATIAEAVCFLTMLSLSQQYAQSGGSLDTYQALAKIVGSGRGWVHYTNLLLSTATAAVLHIGLFRFWLVPRVLSGFGIFAATLGAIGMIRPMIGYSLVLQLLTPLGFAQLALLLWLLVKGFSERPVRQPERSEGSPASGRAPIGAG